MVLLLWMGCLFGGLLDDTGGTLVEPDADTDADADTDTDADTDAALPDPFGWLTYDPACDDFEGTEVPGATSYFVGEFALGGEPSGEETWVLLMNDTAQDAGLVDCTVVWNVTGSVTGSDLTQPFDLAIGAALQTADCPETLYEGEEAYSVTYRFEPDGDRVDVSFKTSGSHLGSGYTNGVDFNYATPGSCMYF